MDKYLSDKRVETAVNRAVKSITDNPVDLERELQAFAETSEGWRQKSMSLEQEKDAIQKKLDKVTKEPRACTRVARYAAATYEWTHPPAQRHFQKHLESRQVRVSARVASPSKPAGFQLIT